MKLEYGQKLVRIKKHCNSWPEVVYVVSADGDHLVKLSMCWPYQVGRDHKMFMNSSQVPRVYRHYESGEQLDLGAEFAKPDLLARLRERYSKKQ